MPDTLLIWFKNTDSQSQAHLIDWAVLADAGSQSSENFHGTNTTLFNLPEEVKSNSTLTTIVLVPGDHVLSTSLYVPAAQRPHIKQTLPFLVEEMIAEPIEEMHVVTGSSIKGVKDHLPVLAVSHTQMQAWLKLLNNTGIRADILLPDTSLVASEPSSITILLDGQQPEDSFALVDITCHEGQFSIKTDIQSLAFVIESIVDKYADQEDALAANIFITPSAKQGFTLEVTALQSQFNMADIPCVIKQIESTFNYLSARVTGKIDMNLLQGPYATKAGKQGIRAGLRQLAYAACFCVALKVIFDFGTGFYINQQTEQVNKDIVGLYQSLFPGDKKIINPRIQMQNHLDAQNSSAVDAGFIDILGMTTQQLISLSNFSYIEVRQLRYDDNRKSLTLDINVREVQQLDALKQKLIEQKLDAVILSANQERQWVKCRMRISI